MLVADDGDAPADGGNLLLRPNLFRFLFFLGLIFSGARIFRRCRSSSGGRWLWRGRSGRLGLRRGLGGTGIRAGLGRLRRVVQSGEESQNAGKNERAGHETSRPLLLQRWADTRSIPAEESRIGGRRTRFAQVGKSKFLANGEECLLGRADVTVVCIERALVDRKTREEFAAVKIVLRKTREPKSRRDFVALLHEMAAFVNFAEKQADGNVFGNFAFDTRKLLRIFIYPDESANFGVNGSEARGGLEGRVGFHPVLGKHAVRARLASDEGKKEGVARGVNEVVAFPFFLRELFHGVALRTAVIDEQGERLFQSCEIGAIGRRIRGLPVRANGNAVHTGAGRNDAGDSYRRRGCVAGVLANFQALHALVDVQRFFIFFLTGNHAFEERSEERRVGKECRSRWSP